MAMDLKSTAIFASWLTIIGDTITVLYEQSQPEEDDSKKTEEESSQNKDNNKKNSEENNSDEEIDYGLIGEYLSFLGDLINALVDQIRAYQEYGCNIPKYVEKGLIGGWLVVLGDILQIQSEVESDIREQEEKTLANTQ